MGHQIRESNLIYAGDIDKLARAKVSLANVDIQPSVTPRTPPAESGSLLAATIGAAYETVSSPANSWHTILRPRAMSGDTFSNLGACQFFTSITKTRGRAVSFLREACLPVISTGPDSFVTLFEFVQEWESATDINALTQSLPELSLGQILSAMEFVRTVAQFNTKGVNLEEVDSADESDSEFMNQVIRGFASKEDDVVLFERKQGS